MKLILAPLRGITTHTFRNIYADFFTGIDEAMAPFIAPGTNKKIKPSVFADIFPENNTADYPLHPQILANNPTAFPTFLEQVYRRGYRQINWNLGCPFPQVSKKKKGSGLLPYPEIIEPVLDFLNNQKKISFTVKTRLGLQQTDELAALLPLFERYRCKSLIIHARTGAQMYRGRADISCFARMAEKTTLPLVYNGDIFHPATVEKVMERVEKTTGYMIGRGLILNPFLPAQIKGGRVPDHADEILRGFFNTLCTAYEEKLHGPGPVLGKMKELWTYMEHSYPGAGRDIRKILKSRDIPTYRRRTEAFFTIHRFIPPDTFFDPAVLG
ncbi:MAG: tRNA-dihydrouridine synthase family protein [Fibrobacterota bacterium]